MKSIVTKQTGVVLFSVSIILSSLILGLLFYHARAEKPSLIVKGLAEREVKGDLALWEINFSSGGDDPATIQVKLEKDRDAVTAFIKNEGFAAEEIIPGRLIMADKLAYGYYQEGWRGERYQVKTSVILRSENVDLVDRVSRMTGDLVKLGVVLSDNYSGPSFLFTRLNDIKGEMLDEAVMNARKSADTFAAKTGSSIKGIKSANQGVFSILPRDMTAGAMEEHQIYKTVRVVSTIDYYIN
ncbi:MAG: SIMPL domain-containing protein [Spirochaetia bacterium]|jgi:hypothetical protein|nr:SIMPL domain-containing protein [Spirochaetia bacterium]